MADYDSDHTLPARASGQENLSPQPARARIRLVWGKTTLEADAQITPAGLLAVGGLVGMILLATAPLVRAASQARVRR